MIPEHFFIVARIKLECRTVIRVGTKKPNPKNPSMKKCTFKIWFMFQKLFFITVYIDKIEREKKIRKISFFSEKPGFFPTLPVINSTSTKLAWILPRERIRELNLNAHAFADTILMLQGLYILEIVFNLDFACFESSYLSLVGSGSGNIDHHDVNLVSLFRFTSKWLGSCDDNVCNILTWDMGPYNEMLDLNNTNKIILLADHSISSRFFTCFVSKHR